MDRKEAILQAAKELFAEKGFHATTTSEVARRAGVAEGTVFHYFNTKAGILLFLFDRVMDDYIEGLSTILERASSGLQAVEDMIRFHFRFGRERSEELQVVMRDFPSNLMGEGSVYGDRVKGRLDRVLELTRLCVRRGNEDGSIRDGPADQVALILRALMVGISRFMLLGPLEVPDLAEQAVEFCMRALAPGDHVRDDQSGNDPI